MTTKRKKIFTIFLIFGLVILVYGLTATYRNQTRPILQENLDNSLQQYRDGTISEIDFATLTPFPWNKLYVFGPYTTCNTVVKALKNPLFRPICLLETNSFIDEGESFYLFTENRLVKQYLLITSPSLMSYKKFLYRTLVIASRVWK